MAKLLKISGKVLYSILEWVWILILFFAFAIRTSPVQTYLAKQVTSYLSKELNAEVKVDKVAIVFIDRAALDGLLIRDLQGDTLIYSDRLLVTLEKMDLAKKEYTIGSADANGAFVHIQRYEDIGFNHSFLRDYFVKDKKKKNKILFKVNSATIHNSRFRYDDHRKDARDSGIDYFHMNATEINGQVADIQIKKDEITGTVKWFKCKEKSGFELKNLYTKANVSPRGIKLADVEIQTNDSYIKSSQFNMLSDHYNCFKYFVDSVRFDARIDESDVSLKDVSYFAYNLEGMEDHVRLKTELYDKVTDLRIKNFDLRYKENTQLRGTIRLDDYRDFMNGFYRESINYAFVDIEELKSLKLPNSAPQQYISLPAEVERLGYFKAHKLNLTGGVNNFVVAANKLETKLGSANMNNGIQFEKREQNDFYSFFESSASDYDIKINSFDLGSYLGNEDLGIVDGQFWLSGKAYSTSNIRFENISGDVFRFDYLGYDYSGITITDGKFYDDQFEGKIDIADDNLNLTYDGTVNFGEQKALNFTIDLTNAMLHNLGFALDDTRVRSKFIVNTTGTSINNFGGDITFTGFAYTANGQEVKLDSITLNVERGLTANDEDVFTIKDQNIGDVKIKGKIDFNHLMDDLNHQLSKVFPALYKQEHERSEREVYDHFTFEAEVQKINPFLQLITRDIKMHDSVVTKLNGHYYGEASDFYVKLESDGLEYRGMKLNGIDLQQIMNKDNVNAVYQLDRFEYNDSIFFDQVFLKTNGGNNVLSHNLIWEEKTEFPSEIHWTTNVNDVNHYDFTLDPSHFFVKQHRWDITHESKISVDRDTIHVNEFELRRNEQVVYVDGKISNQDKHHLNYRITDFQLDEISDFITREVDLTGTINSWGFISNPYHNFHYIGDAAAIDFKVNDKEVGNIFVQSEWDNASKSIFARGDLLYRNNQTFDFFGNYFLDRKDDNLDFTLNFDYTDIQFADAFIDPDVMSEIKGLVNGQLFLHGTPTSPILEGKVKLAGGSAYVDLLGVHFGVEGPIEVDEYGFYINGIPIYDEDGNAGMVVGSVYHDKFQDFNFDLQFDLEEDNPFRSPINGWAPISKEAFLVMDIPYSYEALYYGQGRVTGNANIFGYTDNLEITVDLKTQKGTKLNIPMYGFGEIDDEDFIIFKNKTADTLEAFLEPKFDVEDVYMDLNFDVTPDAEIKIIFNEELGDIISATGTGDISISLDQVGDIRMEGVYTVNKGAYDFAMQPVKGAPTVKQKFFIEEGGNISWSGNPYDAVLNLRTYYTLNANLADISSNQLQTSSGAHTPVNCYLNLTETMSQPAIGFYIEAPQADEIGRSLINRINSDKDELNQQFFSLMLRRRFKPLAGSSSSNGGAALDLVTTQINSMLASVSDDYKLNVDFDTDALTGDNTYEFGISKGFLNDRLILSGSFGVESYGEGESETEDGQLIGDVNLEYLLNESGTFRVNIFNQSTDKTIIQEADLGPFTQGAGLHYQEDFNTFDDFKLVQYFFDVFRKRENKRYPIKRKRQQRPVPEMDATEP